MDVMTLRQTTMIQMQMAALMILMISVVVYIQNVVMTQQLWTMTHLVMMVVLTVVFSQMRYHLMFTGMEVCMQLI